MFKQVILVVSFLSFSLPGYAEDSGSLSPAATPPTAVSAQASSTDQTVSSPVAQSYIVESQRADDNSVLPRAKRVSPEQPLYYYQPEGGSAGLALLLGPLGAMANQSNIATKTKTEADVVEKNFHIDVATSISSATAKFPLVSSPAARHVTVLSPFVLLSRDVTGKLYLRCAVDAYDHANWIGRYTGYVAISKTFSELSQGLSEEELKKLPTDIENGFSDALQLLDDDINGRLRKPTNVYVRSPQIVLDPLLMKMKLVSEDGEKIIVWGAGGGKSRVFTISGYHKLLRSAVTELTPREY